MTALGAIVVLFSGGVRELGMDRRWKREAEESGLEEKTKRV